MIKSKFLSVIVLLFLLTSSKAQDVGKIIINNGLRSYPNFIVSLNGVRLQNDYSSSITFKFVDETVYRVKLLQAGSSSVLNFTISSEPKYVSSYLLTKDNAGNYSLVLQSKSLIMNDEEIQAAVNTVAAVVPVSTVAAAPSQTMAVQVNTAAPTATFIQGPLAMTDAVYRNKLNEVKAKTFDDDKMEHVQNAFEYEEFTTAQVIGLMKLFTFDDKRLEVAKFAYPKTIDKEEFYKTYDHFSFPSSKSSLKDWIKNYKAK